MNKKNDVKIQSFWREDSLHIMNMEQRFTPHNENPVPSISLTFYLFTGCIGYKTII
jgi:hypothetical protein